MIEMNLPLSGATHYNQLHFNLDAPSPVSTSMGPCTPPPFILVQKVPEKLFEKPKLRPNNNPEVSDKMSLALQLAKLDVSNSIRENSRQQKLQTSKKSQTVPTKKPLKVKMHAGSKIYRTRWKMDRGTSYEPQKPLYPASNKQKADFEKSLRVDHGVSHKTRVKFFSPKHNVVRHKIPPAMKDAITSTNDLSLLTNNTFQSAGELQKPGRFPHGSVKKEKLQKRFNKKTPSKSGFLSHYRSPKKVVPNFVKQPTVIARCDDCSKPFVTDPGRERLRFDEDKSSFESSKAMFLKPSPVHPSVNYQRAQSVASSHPSDHSKSRHLSKFCEFNSSLQRKHCCNKVGRTKPTPHPRRRSEKKPMKVATRPRKDDVFTDSSFDYNVEDGAMHPQDANTSFDMVEAIKNNSQFETLYQRLVDIENAEKSIRHRWREIKYEDMKHHNHKLHHNNNNPFQNIKEGIESTGAINISGGKNAVPQPTKDVVRFIPQKPVSVHQSSLNPTQLQAKSIKKELSIPKEIVESIHKNKSDFRKYLNSVFHEPKGKFNPWGIVNELSEEIVHSVIDDVCDEVNEGFDGCVEQLFEAEFARPDQSTLRSFVEQSTVLSAVHQNGHSFMHD